MITLSQLTGCFVGEQFSEQDKSYLHDNVCKDLPIEFEQDGNFYCVLHFPNNKKSKATNFVNVVKQRIDKQENNFYGVYFPDKTDYFFNHTFENEANFEKTLFEDAFFKNSTFNKTVSFDFANLYRADFQECKFGETSFFIGVTFAIADYQHKEHLIINFSKATFEDAIFQDSIFNKHPHFNDNVFVEASFLRTKFFAGVSFFSTKFIQGASFDEANFKGVATFHNTIFNCDERAKDYAKKKSFIITSSFRNAYFQDVRFTNTVFESVDFQEVIFDKVQFWESPFNGLANFELATFNKLDFYKVKFKNEAHFKKTKFKGKGGFFWSEFIDKVQFNEATFENTSDILFNFTAFQNLIDFSSANIGGYLSFNGTNDDEVFFEHTDLNLEYIRIEKPETISFHTVNLHPSWFVNVDARKMIFTNVTWENVDNVDIDRNGIDKELGNLIERKVANPEKVLIKAFDQLIENSESNGHIDETKKFRKQLNALKNYECNIHESFHIGEKDDIRRKVCQDYPAVNEVNGKYYCLWHYTNKEKFKVFEQEFNKRKESVKAKIKDIELNQSKEKIEKAKTEISYDFHYVWFPSQVNFHGYKFEVSAFFRNATFSEGAEFGIAQFYRQAAFHNATFIGGAIFADAIFYQGGYFLEATFTANNYFSKSKFFCNANFSGAKFLETSTTYFRDVIFLADVDFSSTIIKGILEFESNERNEMFFSEEVIKEEVEELKANLKSNCYQSRGIRDVNLNFYKTQISNPQNIFFQNLRVEPNWFVNVDSRNFTFNACRFEYCDGSEINLDHELKKLNLDNLNNSKSIFKITSRQLAENAENNNRFEEASKFRRMAFEIERLERKEKIFNWWVEEYSCFEVFFNCWGWIKRVPFDLFYWGYRWSSGYGENSFRALFILLFFILLIFPFIYTQIEFQVTPKTIPLEVVVENCQDPKAVCKIENRGLNFWNEAIPHSLETASLQTVEYRVPKTPGGSVWIILEKIFAPLQAALLALAIRRKFMR